MSGIDEGCNLCSIEIPKIDRNYTFGIWSALTQTRNEAFFQRDWVLIPMP